MDRQYSIWTYNRTEEWLARNTVPDMILVHGVTLHTAHSARERIEMITDETVEIRNNKGEIVITAWTVPDNVGKKNVAIISTRPRPEQQTERKARRKLGAGTSSRMPHPDPKHPSRRVPPKLNPEV